MKDEEVDFAEFKVFCDGEMVAAACGPRAGAWREASWYAFQYAQDGRVEIIETKEDALDADLIG